MKKLIVLACLALVAPVYALDAACQAVLRANEAHLKASSWTKVMTINGDKSNQMEIRKVDGQYYSFIAGVWTKQGPGFAANLADFVTKIKTGEVKVSNCKNENAKVVDGVNTAAVSFTVEMQGAPAARGTVMIGTADGLPYAETSASVQTTYRYKNVTAPN